MGLRQVIIVGGGAAGMMAAVAAAENGAQVTVLEKNEKLGKKVFITGKGRCNLTNACDQESFFSHIVTNPRFLYSAFHACSNYDVMADMEAWGLPIKTERGERVFPVSDHSSDVIAVLQRRMQTLGVRVRLHTEVKQLLTEEGRAVGVLLKNGENLHAQAVIIATGGLSYASTGSTGDGYRFAEDCGLAVTQLYPSLVPFNIRETFCRDLQGLSLKNVAVTMTSGDKELYAGFGEMLFTHFGVSGPLILTASCYYAGRRQDPVLLHIDLKPALTEKQLDERLLREFEQFHGKQFKNALVHLFPSGLIPVMVQESGIPGEKKVSEVSAADRKKLIQTMKDLTLSVEGTRGFAEAIITQGGVSVKELKPSSMESRKVSGLYFAGEVLDLDAHTGGFNLQIAWSTGRAAGVAAALGGNS